jgi:hypothetical protein
VHPDHVPDVSVRLPPCVIHVLCSLLSALCSTCMWTSSPRVRAVRAVVGDAKVANRTVGISDFGGRPLFTRPFRDARRFPSTRWYPVPRDTHTTLGFGTCPSFKGHSLSPRAEP